MPDSPQQKITLSGQRKGGRPLGSVGPNKLPSQLPEMVGRQFGKLVVISAEVRRQGKPYPRAHLLVSCSGCHSQGWKDYASVLSGAAGCPACARRPSAPRWLQARAAAARQRCTNPKDSNYSRYGGRGIEFRFPSPVAMAVWVQDNLGLHSELEIDRIDNDGHYEAGNLRYSTPAQNVANSTKQRVSAAFHAFRLVHPEIRYADVTLRRLLLSGMTAAQIVERYHQPSRKPKGVYGIYSTADPTIASRSKGS